MNKTCIIYGSSTGTCQDLASRIAAKLGVDNADVFDAGSISAEQLEGYQNLVLGTSTWGAGEMQDDWYDGVETLKGANLAGKKIALFGCGDASSYSDTFCSAMGTIYNDLKDSGATFVGRVDPSDYTFDSSDAIVDGQFVGLPIDEVNEPEKTDDRISSWVASL